MSKAALKANEVNLPDDVAAWVRTVATEHRVHYQKTELDTLGNHITRLAGDNVVLDETELLLLALEKAGHLGPVEAVRLHARYLHKAVP